jgi:hypothetical protein
MRNPIYVFVLKSDATVSRIMDELKKRNLKLLKLTDGSHLLNEWTFLTNSYNYNGQVYFERPGTHHHLGSPVRVAPDPAMRWLTTGPDSNVPAGTLIPVESAKSNEGRS